MVWLPAHTGQFLDYIERQGERLFALFALACYTGLRRGEIVALLWADLDLDEGVAHIRVAEAGDTKSDRSTRTVPLPAPVVAALHAWRKRQAAERLAFGPGWADTGLVFTKEDGTALPGQWVSVRFETLAYRAGLPPVRFHDTRHGAASLCKVAKLDSKYISALLGHSRTSFTDDTSVTPVPRGDGCRCGGRRVRRAKAGHRTADGIRGYLMYAPGRGRAADRQAGGAAMIGGCAHIARTHAPQSSGQVRHGVARSLAVWPGQAAFAARCTHGRHDPHRSANAVWVRAHPGFKSPSLRRAGVAWSLIFDQLPGWPQYLSRGRPPGTPELALLGR
jgi:hypothetical protein